MTPDEHGMNVGGKRLSRRKLLTAGGSIAAAGSVTAFVIAARLRDLGAVNGCPPGPSLKPRSGAAASAGAAALDARDFGARGDGAHDDTAALQAALAEAARTHARLSLTAGTYIYRDNLSLRGASGVSVVGEGDRTILRAASAARSALTLVGCDGILLEGFCLEAPGARARSADDRACGLTVRNSSNIEISNVTVAGTANAGIMITGDEATLEPSRAIRIHDCTLLRTLSDGVHLTEGSSDVHVYGNLARKTGDDSFASIGYETGGQNSDITFRDNVSEDSGASGVAVEGTRTATVENNRVFRSRASGIRVQSTPSYRTLGSSDIVIRGNYLEEVKRGPASVAALMVSANYGDITGVSIVDNTIVRPRADRGIHLAGTLPFQVVDSTVSGNHIDNTDGLAQTLIDVGAVDTVVRDNTVLKPFRYGIASTAGGAGSLLVTGNAIVWRDGQARGARGAVGVFIDPASRVVSPQVFDNTESSARN